MSLRMLRSLWRCCRQHGGQLACCALCRPQPPPCVVEMFFSELWIVAWSLLALSSWTPASVLAFVLHCWPAHPWPAQPKGPAPFAVTTHLVSLAAACCLPAPAEPSVELQRSQLHTTHLLWLGTSLGHTLIACKAQM